MYSIKVKIKIINTGVGKSRFTVVSMQNRVYSGITIYLLIIVLFICIVIIIGIISYSYS